MTGDYTPQGPFVKHPIVVRIPQFFYSNVFFCSCDNQEVDTEVAAEVVADEDPVVVAVVHVDLVVAAMRQTGADSTVPVVVERAIAINGAEAVAVSCSFRIEGVSARSCERPSRFFRLKIVGSLRKRLTASRGPSSQGR